MAEDLNIGELVLFKNNQLIALNKPGGLPVQEDKTGDRSLLTMTQSYCHHPLHLLHRIDRPASGVVLFAKTQKALRNINHQFQQRTVEKTYLAVVRKSDIPTSGTLLHHLKKNGKLNKSFVYENEQKGTKEASLQYQVQESSDNYQLLKLQLYTGRHHQIRAQLAALGCPIKGDVKYGFRRNNRDKSINLHAWKIGFKHPISQEFIEIEAPVPTGDIWSVFETLQP